MSASLQLWIYYHCLVLNVKVVLGVINLLWSWNISEINESVTWCGVMCTRGSAPAWIQWKFDLNKQYFRKWDKTIFITSLVTKEALWCRSNLTSKFVLILSSLTSSHVFSVRYNGIFVSFLVSFKMDSNWIL